MTPRYLLDTNVVSEPIRPQPNRRVMERLVASDGQMAIASIVWHELMFGVERLGPSRKRTVLEHYLRDVVEPALEILDYDRAAAAWHAKERARLRGLGAAAPFADGQIAAIAATRGLVLVSRNKGDFERFEGLELENWFNVDP